MEFFKRIFRVKPKPELTTASANVDRIQNYIYKQGKISKNEFIKAVAEIIGGKSGYFSALGSMPKSPERDKIVDSLKLELLTYLERNPQLLQDIRDYSKKNNIEFERNFEAAKNIIPTRGQQVRAGNVSDISTHLEFGDPNEFGFNTAIASLFSGAKKGVPDQIGKFKKGEVGTQNESFLSLTEMQNKTQQNEILKELEKSGFFKEMKNPQKLASLKQYAAKNGINFDVLQSKIASAEKISQEQSRSHAPKHLSPAQKPHLDVPRDPLENLSIGEIIKKRLDLGRPNIHNQEEIKKVEAIINSYFPLKSDGPDKPKNPHIKPANIQEVSNLFNPPSSESNPNVMDSKQLLNNPQLANRIKNSIHETGLSTRLQAQADSQANTNFKSFADKVDNAKAQQAGSRSRT